MEATMRAFQEVQASTLDAFLKSEDKRQEAEDKREKKRQRREERQDKILFAILAKSVGSQFMAPGSDSSSDE